MSDKPIKVEGFKFEMNTGEKVVVLPVMKEIEMNLPYTGDDDELRKWVGTLDDGAQPEKPYEDLIGYVRIHDGRKGHDYVLSAVDGDDWYFKCECGGKKCSKNPIKFAGVTIESKSREIVAEGVTVESCAVPDVGV